MLRLIVRIASAFVTYVMALACIAAFVGVIGAFALPTYQYFGKVSMNRELIKSERETVAEFEKQLEELKKSNDSGENGWEIASNEKALQRARLSLELAEGRWVSFPFLQILALMGSVILCFVSLALLLSLVSAILLIEENTRPAT